MSMLERAIHMQRCIPALAAAILVCCSPVRFAHANANANADDADRDTVVAIWRTHQVDFVYRSTSVYYACGALQKKIGAILRAVGAHRRIAVDLRCARGELVNFAFARVTLATPVEATPAAVQTATTFDSRQQLSARVRKVRLPTAADIERFPARWRPVTLSHRAGLRLDSGDCDLLSALGKQVFPQLSIRVDKERLRCAQATRLRPRLEVVALMPIPPAFGREANADDGNAT
jgi:hypothetical protein